MDNRRKNLIKASVRSSIEKLLAQANKAYAAEKSARSKRYVKMAFDLLTKHKIRLPKELKNSFCKKCFTVWVPNQTATIYYDKKHHCLRVQCNCGFTKRL